jgi:hypothetical protein
VFPGGRGGLGVHLASVHWRAVGVSIVDTLHWLCCGGVYRPRQMLSG